MRFQRIQPFKGMPLEAVIRERHLVQHKHALDVIAREHGYLNWKKLKDAADTLWSPPNSSAYWHNWCRNHDEARDYLAESGGYLLPALGQCFIADRGYIEFLGLNPDDPRWELIGFDVMEPANRSACDELIAEREKIRLASETLS
ncbi:MAG: hypothetical protein AMXMBFR84_39440 [Candidatus Hydrogenedentota bacterium]